MLHVFIVLSPVNTLYVTDGTVNVALTHIKTPEAQKAVKLSSATAVKVNL